MRWISLTVEPRRRGEAGVREIGEDLSALSGQHSLQYQVQRRKGWRLIFERGER
jgi:hypothetical protein